MDYTNVKNKKATVKDMYDIVIYVDEDVTDSLNYYYYYFERQESKYRYSGLLYDKLRCLTRDRYRNVEYKGSVSDSPHEIIYLYGNVQRYEIAEPFRISLGGSLIAYDYLRFVSINFIRS